MHFPNNPTIRGQSSYWRKLSSVLICGILGAVLHSGTASADTTVKVDSHYDNHQIREGYKGDVDAFQREKTAGQANLQPPKKIVRSKLRHGYSHDIYINHVHTHVWSDRDGDGYYTHFDLSFDADTDYGERWVYARIYLRADGEDYQFFHETEVFEIYSDYGSDEYTVEAKLVANFAAAYYDIRIELFEHGDAVRWDMIDAASHRNLFALPLESDIQDDGPSDAIVHEHAGSTGLASLGLLVLVLLRRRLI